MSPLPALPVTPPQGLTAATAQRRGQEEGANTLAVSQRRPWRTLAWEVVREPMFLLLLGSGALYLLMGDAQEALILLGFVAIIMAVTVLQERRTDRALGELRALSSPRAQVMRDGVPQRIPGAAVVRGDLLLLSEGDRVPADGVLWQAHELSTDESLLTGESEPVTKHAPTDRVLAGTLVLSGQGLACVQAIGGRTQLGRIGLSLDDVTLQPSPLRDEMARLTRRLVGVAGAVCGLLVLLLWALRGDVLAAVLAGITLAMGLLPQELPVILIVFLALAARRLAQQQVLTRRLSAIETLGQTTVLCVDKTGTLTCNRMSVQVLVAGESEWAVPALGDTALPEAFHPLLACAVLASEVRPHDPMELALQRLATQHLAASDPLPPSWQLAREYELSPALMAMSHLWRDPSAPQDRVASKGAPEAVVALCHLPAAQAQRVQQQAAALADRGLRVLGVAQARHPKGPDWPAQQHDFDFEWLGLVGLADPLRPEVPAAVARCQRAGIRVVMITGDHPGTALAIAAQAGISAQAVITGDTLDTLSAPDLAQRLAHTQVFARVKPQQKLALVQALQAQGEVVAMTGDGVNDAPALKAAHIGMAMGLRGTDVAREAASLVLLNDDFHAIVAAIEQGRRTFANLRQAMVYTLAVHLPIIGLALWPAALGWPLVLTPLHIAFLELLIDPACSLVFEAEASAQDWMAQAPRRVKAPLLSTEAVRWSLWQGACVTAWVLGWYGGLTWLVPSSTTASTAAFGVLVMANAALILPCRSDQPGWRGSFRGLPRVSAWVLLGTLLALALVTQVPLLALAFGFVRLPMAQWGLMAASVLVLLGVLQLSKEGWLSSRAARKTVGANLAPADPPDPVPRRGGE
ncbi:cation-translocating P-type ATPase [Curvibacter sp. HBC61]|uniref:Cation-translocating P-type ATPase n=1 Tax=Curvibacter cyanobacteriorum TaxID=3026422 RepID=A0ABT5MZR9_9BURK|nr:cation-translocating P-type ATPase [Curvibacter sp. HBC61]MDD0838761.1 cation-translocating P-type ATPase [Curvibacter sp. HBC61]